MEEDNPIKATLEFKLPEAQTELELAIHAPRMWSVIWALDQEMRNHLKHDGIRTATELAEYVHSELAEVINLMEHY